MEATQCEKDFSKETVETEASIYEYDPWLLDDHPLRSYPTECIPGLGTYLDESWGKRNKAFLRVGCVLIGCLAAFQLIRFLPTHTKSLSHTESPHIFTRPTSGVCIFPTLDTRPDALESSLALGCNGLRTTVGMYDGELQIGNVGVASGLDPLLTHLGQAPPDVSSKEVEMDSVAHVYSPEAFLLILDAKTALHDLYPHLIEQLDTFRQRGYLSHWNGERFVQRAVAIVVTGEVSPNSDCVNHSYADLFWAPLPEIRVTPHAFRDYRHLSPICVV